MAFNLTPASILSDVETGLGAIGSILGIVTDVNAVLDQETLQQVFADARPMKARIVETSRVTNYPVESGATLSDFKVINPIEIEMPFIIDAAAYSSAYQAIRNAFLNSTLLAVQCRTGTYQNMIIADMPHEEDPDMFTAITQIVRFREIILIQANANGNARVDNFKTAVPNFQSVINRGLQTAIGVGAGAFSYVRAIKVWGS